MTVDERIINALSGLAPVERDEISDYRAPSYLFNYSTVPISFRNNKPTLERYLIQVHLFCPVDFNNLKLRADTKDALFAAGFGWPDEVDAGLDKEAPGDVTLRHFVYECEWTERLAPGRFGDG